jgi:REP element-mobilizing transposase RayT
MRDDRMPGEPPGERASPSRRPEEVAPASSRPDRGSRQDGGATADEIRIRDRGYLPHWERMGSTYFVTFRLAGTLPQSVLAAWAAEQEEAKERIRLRGDELTADEEAQIQHLFSDAVEAYLDAGEGGCWLRDARIAGLVADALKHFDGSRYQLHAWCVMPNHVHAVFTVPHAVAPPSRRLKGVAPASSRPERRSAAFQAARRVAPDSDRPDRDGRQDGGATPLAAILHSWKSFTANQANRTLGRTGEFWQREYYDHPIRDKADFRRCVRYTVDNPVKAGLCSSRKAWRWTGVKDFVSWRRCAEALL